MQIQITTINLIPNMKKSTKKEFDDSDELDFEESDDLHEFED